MALNRAEQRELDRLEKLVEEDRFVSDLDRERMIRLQRKKAGRREDGRGSGRVDVPSQADRRDLVRARNRADVGPWDRDVSGRIETDTESLSEAARAAMDAGGTPMLPDSEMEFADQQFSVGTQGMGVQFRSSNRRRMSAVEAMTELLQLPEDDLIHVQAALFDAGLYDGAFRWGVVDPNTRKAFQVLMGETLLSAGRTVEQVLEKLINSNIDSMRGRLGEYDPETGERTSGEGIDDGTGTTLADPHELADRADQIGRDILGRALTEAEERLVVTLVTNEQVKRAGPKRAAGDPDPDELAAFMRALAGRESGGDPTAVNPRTGAYGTFQIMPSNWRAWAVRAGLPSTAPRTPANQERVAKVILSDYYRQHKNWRDVAIAWYAGPGAWQKERRRPGFFDQPHGRGNEPSINGYADQVMQRFSVEVVAEPPPGTEFAYDVETGLQTEVARLDPTRAALGDVESRMDEFFSLLGDV